MDAGDRMILARLNQLESYLRLRLDGQSDGAYDEIPPSMNNDEPEANGSGNENGNRSDINLRFEEGAFNPFELPQVRHMFSQPLNSQHLLSQEMTREPLQMGDSLSLEFHDNPATVQAFFDTVNIWYACVNPLSWQTTYQTAAADHFREGPESCLVLLVLALGKAGTTDASSTIHEPAGMQYFSAAWSLIPSLVINHNVISSQCIVLASIYLLYLTRPVEAWTLLSTITMKLQLHLTNQATLGPEARKLFIRVIWNAILLESDILAELALPQSGLIARFSNLDLPSAFLPPPDSDGEDLAATLPRDDPWYLMASIYLYRLRIRISETLYSATTPTSLNALEPVITNLDSSLSSWSSTYLDPSASVASPVQNLLGFRYHATRALIYRPALHVTLSSFSSPSSPPMATTNSMVANGTLDAYPAAARSMLHTCLDSCMGALEHFADYSTTYFPFAWQSGLAVVWCAVAAVATRDERPRPHSQSRSNHAPTSSSPSASASSAMRSPNAKTNAEQYPAAIPSFPPPPDHFDAVLEAVTREIAAMARGGVNGGGPISSTSPSRSTSPSLARAGTVMEEILAVTMGEGKGEGFR